MLMIRLQPPEYASPFLKEYHLLWYYVKMSHTVNTYRILQSAVDIPMAWDACADVDIVLVMPSVITWMEVVLGHALLDTPEEDVILVMCIANYVSMKF